MMPDYEVIRDTGIVGWRGQCACGWPGELWERVTSPAAADFERRRDYFSPDDFAHASLKVQDAIHDEWKTHIAPQKPSPASKQPHANTTKPATGWTKPLQRPKPQERLGLISAVPSV